MADTSIARRRWIGRLTFAGLSLFIIFSHLIPLETAPPGLGGTSLQPIAQSGATPDADAAFEQFVDPVRWIAPQFMLLLVCAWVVRRPSFAPVWVIAAVFFLADLLFQRPPGLWTALVLILTEMLRARAQSMRTLTFFSEWATVAAGICAISVLYWSVLSLVLVPQAALGLAILQLGLTLASYPGVVFISYALFGVNRAAPGQVDASGHQL